MSINVQLPKFEGPLGLLLYLIRKEEMDIMDIKIHEITHQYLEYIKLMKELDLEVAGEFVAMAATLIQIKSRMLLPQYDENGEVVETEDPRKELVQKLIEYQKYQEAAKALYERPLLGRDLWIRGVRETLQPKEDEIVLEENALFSLIGSYRRIIKAAKKKIHQVSQKTQSIAGRILEMKDRLIPGQRVILMDLVSSAENKGKQLLITFLSALELGKMGFVSLYQSEVYGDIWIDTKKPIEGDAISRVEEYDSMGAEASAEAMITKAKKEAAAEEELQSLLKDNESQTQLSLEPLVGLEDVAGVVLENELATDDFVLKDGDDLEAIIANDMEVADLASDDEIFAAEKELFGESIDSEEVALNDQESEQEV